MRNKVIELMKAGIPRNEAWKRALIMFHGEAKAGKASPGQKVPLPHSSGIPTNPNGINWNPIWGKASVYQNQKGAKGPSKTGLRQKSFVATCESLGTLNCVETVKFDRVFSPVYSKMRDAEHGR